MELVSVLMCTYNEPVSFIEKSVESILGQSYKNIEFIIVIDNPKNELIKRRLREYKIKDKRIKLIYNENNIGLIASLNKGLKYCKGYYIARMDADDISKRDRIEIQIKFLKGNNLDLVGSYYKQFSEESNISKVYKFPIEHEACKKQLRYNNCIPHPTWLMKKDVYEKLNGYRDIDTCEDYDFILRASSKGISFANCPEVLFYYRYNNESISRKNESKQKIITEFLAFEYRKKNYVDIKEYYKFLKSKTYNEKLIKEEILLDRKKKFKSENKIILKYLYLIIIVFSATFIRERTQKIAIKYILGKI